MWLNIHASTKGSKCHEQIWKGQKDLEKMRMYERGMPSRGNCLGSCIPATMHTITHASVLVELLLCAGHRTRLWNTMVTKPEFLFSWCLHTSGRGRHWSSNCTRDFPGGPVVKNPPSNAGDAGSIPGQGTKMPHATGQLSPHATTTEPRHHN